MPNDRCYSPPHLVKVARDWMGHIDLDPASCAEANQVVGADTYFTEEQDGLRPDWWGRVWLNEPFSRPAPWIDKLIESTRKHVIAACALTSNDLSTRWAQRLLRHSDYMVPLRGRTQFWGPDVKGNSNRSGHVLWFLGGYTDFTPRAKPEIPEELGRLIIL